MSSEWEQMFRNRDRYPRGSTVRAVIASSQPWNLGIVGLLADLPPAETGLGFIDVVLLHNDPKDWPEAGTALECEVLQHHPHQIRRWPLDDQFRNPDALKRLRPPAWPSVKQAYPVGRIIEATVTDVYVLNREYSVQLTPPDSGVSDQAWRATLSWAGTPPKTGDQGRYIITAHLNNTCRLLVEPVPENQAAPALNRSD